MNHSEKKSEFKQAIIMATIFNLVLCIVKIFAGQSFNSHSLIIDGIHSFSDLLTDGALFWISLLAHRGPDENHPYGHERIETLGTVGLGAILLITAGALVYETVEKIFFFEGVKEIPHFNAIYVALLSIAMNEIVFQFTKFKARKINSALLEANAWHHRTDALSSVVVVIGILLSRTSLPWFDDLAALIIAIMIAKVGWDYLNQSLVELADTGLKSAEIKELERTILEVEGVKSTHNLRTRKMGEKVLVDVNIEVDPLITVSEGHEIASWCAKNLKENFPSIADVTVHTDTENDMVADFTHNYDRLLPLRNEVLTALTSAFQGLINLEELEEIRLHYIGKKIKVELIVSHFPQDSSEKIKQLNHAASQYEWFGSVSFFTKVK